MKKKRKKSKILWSIYGAHRSISEGKSSQPPPRIRPQNSTWVVPWPPDCAIPLRAMHRGASYDIHRRCCAHWCSVAVHLWHAQVHLLELTIEGPLIAIFFSRYLYDFCSLPILCAECNEGAFSFHVWHYFIFQAYLNLLSCIKVLSITSWDVCSDAFILRCRWEYSF